VTQPEGRGFLGWGGKKRLRPLSWEKSRKGKTKLDHTAKRRKTCMIKEIAVDGLRGANGSNDWEEKRPDGGKEKPDQSSKKMNYAGFII